MGIRPLHPLSLNALRFFEATARHLSFTKAAEELHVTQAAVSRQVRELEATLDRQLFVRLHRRVALTAVGRQLADELGRSFGAIERVVTAIRNDKRQKIRLSVEPAFAARWLMPRVSRFLAQNAELDLEIESTDALSQLGRDADIAIRYIDAVRSGKQRAGVALARISCFPVMSPALKKKTGALRKPGDLARCLLLHEDDGRYWHNWFAAAGATVSDSPRRVRLNDVALVLQAAVDGQGVALGDDLLASDDLCAGKLIKPFDVEIPYGTYWLLQDRSARTAAAQKLFHNWLSIELSATVPAVRLA